MDYVKLGTSGLEVSRLCLGCMGFGAPDRGADSWTLDEPASLDVLRAALDAGINFFDTANVYSDGHSEEIVGELARQHGRRDELVIATKVFSPMRPGMNASGLSRKVILTEIDNSLRRLGTDYVDLYQIHRWDPTTPVEETLATLHGLVAAGKVRYLGASSMHAWQFATLQFTARANGWTPFVSMQNHYNLLNREEEREMLPFCLDQGISSLPWSPLARGRLARDWSAATTRTADDAFGDSLYADSGADDHTVIKQLHEVANAREAPYATIALAWLLGNPAVAAPVIGVTRSAHLRDAIAALDVELTLDETFALEQAYVPHRVAGFE
jgi:1-deoxyxylulose-5-phosphate synthase